MLSELLKNNKTTLQKTNSYLLPHVNKIIGLVERLEKIAGHEFTDAFKRQELPKGTYLLKAGTVCRHVWFLEKGIARIFACKNAVEITRYFFFPSEMIDSVYSSSLNVPSEASIQLLEDSIVYSLPKSRLEELKTAFPLISEIEKLLLECHANWMEERIYNNQFLSAQEHYQYLLATQPYLVRHISLNHLASYLGITRETLSRIRNARYEWVRV